MSASVISEAFTAAVGFPLSQGSTKTVFPAISILKAECPSQVIFTSYSTSSLNLLNYNVISVNKIKVWNQ
jgi:hypothetical protein